MCFLFYFNSNFYCVFGANFCCVLGEEYQVLRHTWKELMLLEKGDVRGDREKLRKLKGMLSRQLADLNDKLALLQVSAKT